ncbi:MAG: hypothetical protein AAFQ87_26380, partial [Bacteroidota bacterium]
MSTKILLITLISLLSCTACEKEEPPKIVESVAAENVFVLPIRKLKDGQDIEDFKAKRDAYVATLEAEDGTLRDREFQPFFEFTNSGLDVSRVFVGLTSFQNAE